MPAVALSRVGACPRALVHRGTPPRPRRDLRRRRRHQPHRQRARQPGHHPRRRHRGPQRRRLPACPRRPRDHTTPPKPSASTASIRTEADIHGTRRSLGNRGRPPRPLFLFRSLPAAAADGDATTHVAARTGTALRVKRRPSRPLRLAAGRASWAAAPRTTRACAHARPGPESACRRWRLVRRRACRSRPGGSGHVRDTTGRGQHPRAIRFVPFASRGHHANRTE